MNTPPKQNQAFIYSSVGVVVMAVILIAVYVISGVVKARIDMTAEGLYTLSPGTRSILEKVRQSDTPVQINFYSTQSAKEMPVELKTYAQRVEELLGEYRKASGGRIEIKKFDPRPDTEAEDSANLDGVQGQMIGGGLGFGNKIYLGLAVRQLDANEVIPFLAPDREKLLEYDLSRAISRVITPSKPVIGVMTPLPAFGQAPSPMMMQMGQMNRQEPWIFISELKSDFQVRQVPMSGEDIPDEIKVLIVIHPKNISNKAQYAIDQFVLRGGKLIAFVDPYSIVDSRSVPGMNPLQAAQQGGSSMDLLFRAWGIEYDVNKVVADMNFVTQIRQQSGPQPMPAVLSMNEKGMNKDDVITSQIDNVLIPFAGAFSGTPADGLKETVLLHSTENSQLIDRFMAEFSGEQTAKDFARTGKELKIAIRLAGKFKTAFPDGKPTDGATTANDDKASGAENGPPSLKESTAESVVVLVGDSDLIFDQFCAQVQNFFGQRLVQLVNGNLPFAQSLVEQMAGDSSLISVRSRATMNRPFTVIREMQARAQDNYRSKIKELEKDLQETQTRLNELQQARGAEAGNQRFVLSPEQQAEIKKFQQRQAEVNKELRTVRRSLNRDIESLETSLKWINIAGVPLLVAIGGVSLAILKKKRTAAR